MATLEDINRAELEEMAAKADKLKKFGKPVTQLDEIELKASIWAAELRRIDEHHAMVTPLVEELERAIRRIETDGFKVTINRSDVGGLVDLSVTIDV